MFFGSCALFVLVMVLFGIAVYRPGMLRRFTARQIIIAGGLVMPLPILVALTIVALVLGEQILPHPDRQVTIIVTEAEQWEWTFSYPESGKRSTVLHVPAGEPFDVQLVAHDVIHSFWVPRLGGKLDAIPGHINTIRLEVDEPGVYWGVCAEYCGVGHDGMRFRVEAHRPDEFASVIEALP